MAGGRKEQYVKLHGGEETPKEESHKKEKTSSAIHDRLLKARKIVLSNEVNAKVVDGVIRQLLVMDEDDKEAPITFFINSPGGSVYDGFALFDFMKYVSAPIKTIVMGLAASFGSILAIGAKRGNRFAFPNSKFMIHQPLIIGSVRGSASDIEIETKEMIRVKNHLVELYVNATGQDEARIRRDIERNTWFTAAEAKDYGLIDRIITASHEA